MSFDKEQLALLCANYDRRIDSLGAENERLKDENTKLRKLAAEMYPYAKAFLQDGLILGYIDSKSYDWYLQLREMGIEVEA